MEKDFIEEERYLKAQKRLKAVKGFYMNLFWYLMINIIWIIVVLNLNAVESFFQYGFWGMGYEIVVNIVFWGIGLFVHWFLVFGKHLTFSKRWEERKIKELIEKDNF
jgi:hypothetical protein|tara:strand:- start:2544 stop:2864 length:321 start_codon:yes stop_codon:yes gene_type:complete